MPGPRLREPPSPNQVRAQWEAIGPSFHPTRRRPWEPVESWVRERDWGEEDVVLDLACGNGRHGAVAAEAGARVVGADVSSTLLTRAAASVEPVLADATQLPFQGDAFAGGLFVAGVHHLLPRTRRWSGLAELARTVEPGGRVLVTAWALWQDRWLETLLRELPEALRTGANLADRVVHWRAGEDPVPRAYHLYTRHEMREDLEAVGFREVRVWGTHLTGSRLPDNWFAEAVAP